MSQSSQDLNIYETVNNFMRLRDAELSQKKSNLDLVEDTGPIYWNYYLLYHLSTDDTAENIIQLLNQAFSEKKLNISQQPMKFFKSLNEYMNSEGFKREVTELRDAYRSASRKFGIAAASVTIAFIILPVFLAANKPELLIALLAIGFILGFILALQKAMHSKSRKNLQIGLDNLQQTIPENLTFFNSVHFTQTELKPLDVSGTSNNA